VQRDEHSVWNRNARRRDNRRDGDGKGNRPREHGRTRRVRDARANGTKWKVTWTAKKKYSSRIQDETRCQKAPTPLAREHAVLARRRNHESDVRACGGVGGLATRGRGTSRPVIHTEETVGTGGPIPSARFLAFFALRGISSASPGPIHLCGSPLVVWAVPASFLPAFSHCHCSPYNNPDPFPCPLP